MSTSRITFVIGKGGVGKSTVATGLAQAAHARTGEAVLVEFGEGPSALRARGGAPTFEHVTIHVDDAVERAAESVFGSKILARLALSNFAMKPVVRATPALRELAVLELVRQLAASRPRRPVVVDLPATGHGLAWLQVARKGRELFDRGPLYQLCQRIESELLDPEHTRIVVVTLPEKLVLAETLELCASLADQVGLPASTLIVNRVPYAPTDRVLEVATALATRPDALGAAASELTSILETRHQLTDDIQRTLESTLGEAARRAVLLPLLPSDPDAATVTTWLEQKGAT